MAVSVLRRLAATAPASVYPVIGQNALGDVEDLSVCPGVAFAASPRHAGLLLVAGGIRAEDRPALRRLHDQLPHPRATLWWGAQPEAGFPAACVVGPGEDPGPGLAALHGELMRGQRSSEDDLLPDQPPAPWRGRGDHGQGGEGMMGGKPYGRPMPMTDDDLRDGLALDAYTAPFGPFLPMLAPGLLLEATLQGDVIQRAKVLRPPLPQHGDGGPRDALRNIARLIRVLGLACQADRLLRAAAARSGPAAGRPGALSRRLAWTGAFRAIPPGLGTVAAGGLAGHARNGAAAGRSDVRDRLRRWCEQAAQPDRPAGGVQEGDAAPAPAQTTSRLVDLLPGLEWSEAILVINSFDIATLRRLCPADETDAEQGTDGEESGGMSCALAHRTQHQ